MKKIDRMYTEAIQGLKDRKRAEALQISARVVSAYFTIYQDYGEDMPEYKDNEEWYRKILQYKDYGANYEDFEAYYNLQEVECSGVIDGSIIEFDKYMRGD